ncbi:hypothetical protein DRQ53_07950 [bacterium]|nr:MAG: hypothetical protein DRQ32_05390 [bacterium]RKZ15837.1 MAG: hypothetical protein DRQ53_07950 [bacterium]
MILNRPVWRTALVVVAVAIAGFAVAGDSTDEAAIEQAVTNYVTSIYEMKPELVDESVHPRLQKVGYMPAEDGSGYNESWMTHAELKDLAASLNKDGMFDPETAKLEVTVIDHTDKIAVVKLDAAWGTDYIHLAKTDGKWMIMNVIWQLAEH